MIERRMRVHDDDVDPVDLALFLALVVGLTVFWVVVLILAFGAG